MYPDANPGQAQDVRVQDARVHSGPAVRTAEEPSVPAQQGHPEGGHPDAGPRATMTPETVSSGSGPSGNGRPLNGLRVPNPVGTSAGDVIAERYALRARVGSDLRAGAEFWRAEDTILQRDVAITVLRRLPLDGAPDPDSSARAEDMIVRALRAGCFEHPGCARLLDVLAAGSRGMPEDVLGVAVTEWVPGRSLAETVADGLIRPLSAARMVEPLAAAAEDAHGHGLVLGCDHPQRVRVTPDGRVQVAFVLPRPGLTPLDDVRGIGAILYTLLTSAWPLSGSDAARAGLAAADRPHGEPPAPSAVRRGVPVELDAVCIGTLGIGGETASGRVHTAAAVRSMLDEVVAEDDRSALFPPVDDGTSTGPGDVWQDHRRDPARKDPDRRRKLLIGLGVLAVGVLVVLGYLGVQLGSLFGDGGGGPAIVVGGSAVPGQETDTRAAQPTPGVAITNPQAAVFSPVGDRDNASRVSRAIDGDPSTSWSTSEYRQPFPALKPGVGIMASFVSVEQLSRLTIQSPSAGTVVEVRSAPSVDSRLEDTVLLDTQTLGAGSTTISLADSQPVEHVLVWITKLGGGGTENVTQIDELTFYRADV
ncbi:MAG: protein kinase family protein [Pseudonocardia sp.]|nr:protein kinase family protein [Pseudonocardia sp.]